MLQVERDGIHTAIDEIDVETLNAPEFEPVPEAVMQDVVVTAPITEKLSRSRFRELKGTLQTVLDNREFVHDRNIRRFGLVERDVVPMKRPVLATTYQGATAMQGVR